MSLEGRFDEQLIVARRKSVVEAVRSSKSREKDTGKLATRTHLRWIGEADRRRAKCLTSDRVIKARYNVQPTTFIHLLNYLRLPYLFPNLD